MAQRKKKSSNKGGDAGIALSSGSAGVMDKKAREAEIKATVKAEQNKKREEAMKKMEVKKPSPKTMTFDAWYSLRKSQIAEHHRKEVLKADFKARKCEEVHTMEDWDKLLLEYGVKL